MSFTPFSIWEKFGTTTHEGGIGATHRLMELCQVSSGQVILELGCGTGYTACTLARNYHVRVKALDITPNVIEEAQKRANKLHVEDQVTFIQGDAHLLPFPANIFDCVLAESVLVFGDVQTICSEVRRVLKPGGIFGANEVTLLKSDPSVIDLLQDQLHLHPLDEAAWQETFNTAGFTALVSTTHAIDLADQMRDHLKIDGARKYLGVVVRSLFDKTIRDTFFNRKMLRAARYYRSHVGYGLYVSKKA